MQSKRRRMAPVGPGEFVSKDSQWEAKETPKLQRVIQPDGRVEDVPLTDAKGNVIKERNPAAVYTIEAISGKGAKGIPIMEGEPKKDK